MLTGRCAVSGSFDRLDQVLDLDILACGDDRFVRHANNSFGNAFDSYKCRPHFFGAPDASGHACDLQIDGFCFLCLHFDVGSFCCDGVCCYNIAHG